MTRPKLYLHEKLLTPIQINEEERSFVMSHQLEKHIVKRYSQAFKQKVVCEIEAGQLSVGQAQKLYRIGGSSTIENWINQLGKNHLLAQRVRIETTEEVNRVKELESDKQELESALAKAHLKIATLESLLGQAEQLCGIDIKKSETSKHLCDESIKGVWIFAC